MMEMRVWIWKRPKLEEGREGGREGGREQDGVRGGRRGE
jgi:hypothetical protein